MVKIGVSDLKKQADSLIAEGKMPSREELLAAVTAIREKYGDKIKQAQKGGK
jgi:vacuolar-type H+-ATPase subunit H